LSACRSHAQINNGSIFEGVSMSRPNTLAS